MKTLFVDSNWAILVGKVKMEIAFLPLAWRALSTQYGQCPTERAGFCQYRESLGRVLKKTSGSGRVWDVEIFGYFQVSCLRSGISGYFLFFLAS